MMAYRNCHIAGGPIRTKKPLLQSRVELYLQFEGCIRHTTLWELMVSKKIQIPAPEPVETPQALSQHQLVPSKIIEINLY